MKEKESVIAEDILAQLNNSRTPQTSLIPLYDKLTSAKLSNVQRTRFLKTVALHCHKDGSTTDLRVAALSSVLPSIHSVFSSTSNAASGAEYNLLETCSKILQEYVSISNSHHIDIVDKALEIISLVNAATFLKLFSSNVSSFKKIMTTCLSMKETRFHALSLLATALSVSNSGKLAESISEDLVSYIQLVYPLIFNVEEQNVHSAALKVMKEIKLSTKPQPFWNQLKEETQKNYCKRMVEMVNCKTNWPEVWKCIVNLFGEELHSGGQLINHMLEVLERAFKHSDFEWTRVQAFECWNTLIDNFKTGLKNRKRIDLIMIPLKANNHRIETLALAKLKTYDHLLATLGKDLVSSPDILTNFLTFCFGSEKTSCPPVKSYPVLHDKCVECILKVLQSPYGVEMFKKSHKELVTAVGECFILESASSDLLLKLWIRLLELVSQREGTEVLKTLFNMINTLVIRAGNKELTVNLKMQQAMSPPSKPTTRHLDEELGRKIGLIIVHGLVHSSYAISRNFLKMRSLYVGSLDVMNGTPTLLLMEWLLSPPVMLGAGGMPQYSKLVSKIWGLRSQEPNSNLEFAQLILRKLLVFDESLRAEQKTLLYEYTTNLWCTLAQELNESIRCEGSINQGDAAEHDFSAIYSILLFPLQNLHVDLKLIEKCVDPWSDLFFEACQQAELVPTASLQLLCEQVCVRLTSVTRRSSSKKQCASMYLFLTCVLEVASKRLKSKKSFKWVLKHISSILKDLNEIAIDHDVIFDQAINCAQHCLKQTPITLEVVQNLSPIVCSLLRVKSDSADTFQIHSDTFRKLCTLLDALRDALIFIQQHGSSKESFSGILKKVADVGKSHTSEEMKVAIDEFCYNCILRSSEEEEKSQSVGVKAAFLPASRITFSPKPKKSACSVVQMSPSNLSPGGTKRKLQATVCGSDGKFVRIETPPKKIILTEHQKEVRRERRQDIPALYQDLSQDTQSMSQDSTQDFVALPATPKGKSGSVLDEDTCMDVVSSFSPHALSAKKVVSAKSSKKTHVESDSNSELKCFTPPSGFMLPSIEENAKSLTNADNQDQSSGFRQETLPGKENEDVTSSSKSNKLNKAAQKGTLTRSSFNTTLTTRSGKVMKRTSLAPETDFLKTRKSSRKSLPASFSEDQEKKGAVETVALESDTDTESVSSIASDGSLKAGKTFLRPRRSIKREISMESDTDSMSEKEKLREPKSVTDKLQKDTSKSEPSENKAADDSHESKSDADDVPLSKLIGGKVLTRSRSNSSLDDVSLVKKSKTCSPDVNAKTMSPVIELSTESEESPEHNECKSPRKNSTMKKTVELSDEVKAETSPIDRKSRSSNRVGCSSPVHNGLEKDVQTSKDAQITSKNSNMASPKCLRLNRLPSKGPSSSAEEPRVEKGEQSESLNHSTLSPLSGQHRRKEANGSEDSIITESDNGTEESQEIIESSQEPMLQCLKPCLVSLEHFRCTEVNEKVEFENLTIERGPKPNSPYKILVKDSPPSVETVEQKSACRRSLILDGAEKSSSLTVKEVSPSKSSTNGRAASSKSLSTGQISVSDEIAAENGLKKVSFNAESENNCLSKVTLNKEGKERDVPMDCVENPPRNDSMPEWMHDKKDSPLTKPLRTIRGPSARSQAFMKSVAENVISISPPKAVDVSPLSSPVQSKRLQKSGMDSNTTPIIKRSSRAAQLLGLGQAAAARGGDTVVSSASRSLRVDKTGENEESESLANNGNSMPSSTVPSSAASAATNTILASVSVITTPVASPSVRRNKLLDLESLKFTPQKCLEDKGNKEDWVPKDWAPMATPDSSILKRKREVDSDAPSPSLKRKRVSFRDPPLSKLLRFGETSEGTVFTSDQPMGAEKVLVVNLNHEESLPTESKEDKKEEQLDEMAPQIRGKGSPEKKKDSTKPKDNSLENSSPQKLDSFSHDQEENDNGVKEKSPKKSSEVLSGRCESRKAAQQSASIDNIQGHNEMEVDVSLCDDELPQSGSEPSEVETQGMLDDLHRMPSISTPICANLTDCTHSVELISSKLTSAVWKKSLLRELTEGGIRTVGDLARLTEEQLDRLPVKPPKRTNVCCVLEDFEKQHPNLTDVNCKLLKSRTPSPDNVVKSLEDILSNASNEEIINALSEAGTKYDFCRALVLSMPLEDVIKFFKLEDLIKFFKLEDLIKFFKLEDLIKFFKPEDLIKFFKPEGLIKFFKPEDLIKFFEPKEVLKVLKLEDVIKFLKIQDVMKFFQTEDVINSLKAEDVARVVASNNNVMQSIPVDVCAEAYISQAHKSSGSVEKDMSVEQLTAIFNRVSGRTIQSTIFPTVPSLLSTVYMDTMRDYVVRECSPTELIQKLECNKAKECALKLVPKLKPEDFAQRLNSTKAAEFTAELLPKLSPSVIAEQIEDDKVEETVKALLLKLNKKRSLKFMLEQSVNIFNQLE